MTIDNTMAKIGRSMKNRENIIAPFLTSAQQTAWSAPVLLRLRLGCTLTPGCTRWSLHDDPIARLQALLDRPKTADLIPCRDGTRHDFVVVVDKVQRAHPCNLSNRALWHQEDATFSPVCTRTRLKVPGSKVKFKGNPG